MTRFIIISILIILFLGFLYRAYLPDYRRNPKQLWRSLIGMFLGGIGFEDLNEKLKKWATSNNKRTKK